MPATLMPIPPAIGEPRRHAHFFQMTDPRKGAPVTASRYLDALLIRAAVALNRTSERTIASIRGRRGRDFIGRAADVIDVRAANWRVHPNPGLDCECGGKLRRTQAPGGAIMVCDRCGE